MKISSLFVGSPHPLKSFVSIDSTKDYRLNDPKFSKFVFTFSLPHDNSADDRDQYMKQFRFFYDHAVELTDSNHRSS